MAFQNKRFSNNTGRGASEMHNAVCSECNADCQVPFKPNGRKPVLCSNCFHKDGAGAERFERPRFDDRPRFEKPAFRPAPPSTDMLEKQLRMLNEKVDQILDILESLGEEGEEEDLT